MPTIVEKLRALQQEYQGKADAIGTTLGLLNGHATTAKQQRHASVVEEALVVDAERRASKKTKKPARGAFMANKRATRQRTAEHLAALDVKTPTPLAEWREKVGGHRLAIGVLTGSGLIRKKGGGWIRTAKTFTP
jgi:hypothetical protein